MSQSTSRPDRGAPDDGPAAAGNGTGQRAGTWVPEPTGDPRTDAVLERLTCSEQLAPAEEAALYHDVLQKLQRLLDERPPGPAAL